MKVTPSVMNERRAKWSAFRTSGITMENGGIVAADGFMDIDAPVRAAIIGAATNPAFRGQFSSGDFGWAETKDVRGFWRIDEDKDGKMTMVVGKIAKREVQ